MFRCKLLYFYTLTHTAHFVATVLQEQRCCNIALLQVALQYCRNVPAILPCIIGVAIILQYCSNIARTLPCNVRLATILQYCSNIARTLTCNVPVATILQYFGNIARTSKCNVSVATTQQNCLHIAVQYCSGNIVETVQQYSEATMTLTKFEIWRRGDSTCFLWLDMLEFLVGRWRYEKSVIVRVVCTWISIIEEIWKWI